MTLLDLFRRLFGRRRRSRRTVIVRIVPLADVPKTVHFNDFAHHGLPKGQSNDFQSSLATPNRRDTLTTTATPTTHPAVTLTNDQAFSLDFSSGANDAEGYPTGAAAAPPSIAVQNTDGTASSAVLFAFDTASPETAWFKRAPFTAGDSGTATGQVLATFADGVAELTPFTFSPGTAEGDSETEGPVVPLSAVPSTVTWPTPAAA